MKRKLNDIEKEDANTPTDAVETLDVSIQTYRGPNLTEVRDNLQFYANYILSSVLQSLSFRSSRISTIPAIPSTVQCILKYNNIHLCQVKMYTTYRLLPEPIVGWITDDKQNAELYINEEQFNEYCVRVSLGYVTWSPAIDFSSVVSDIKVPLSVIKCAVLCDHVAQHLIYEYYNNLSLDADPHTFYNREGTTFSSMLKISKLITPTENKSNTKYNISLPNFNFPM